MQKPTKYLLLALSSFMVLLLIYACNALFLFRAGELATIDDLVAFQQDRGAIVNPLYRSLLHFKYESYRHRKPEVVIIGTSRAMQFRAYHFRRPFYNLGGVDGTPEDFLRLYENLLQESPPKLAIITLDFWRYCAREGVTSTAAFNQTLLPSDTPSSIVRLPLDLMADGKLDAASYLKVLKEGSPDLNGLRFIGIPATLQRHGFARDGSRYTFMVPNHETGAPLAARWSETMERIASSTSNFRRNCSFDRGRVDRLLFDFVDRLRSHGTQVVLIFAPMPEVVLKAMAEYGSAYDYVDELRRYVIDHAAVPVFDYHRGSSVGSPDCEFRDGFHGGEVTYMRMLLDATAQPGNPLADYVNLPFLEQAVAAHPGRLTVGSTFIQQAMGDYLAQEAGAEGCHAN